jgi:hypothetical protein
MKKRQGSIDYRNKHFNKAKEQSNLESEISMQVLELIRNKASYTLLTSATKFSMSYID